MRKYIKSVQLGRDKAFVKSKKLKDLLNISNKITETPPLNVCRNILSGSKLSTKWKMNRTFSQDHVKPEEME